MFAISEEAARKRTTRCLAKLQSFMEKRSAKVSLQTLTGLMVAPPAQEALQSALRAIPMVCRGTIAAGNVVALANHAVRVLRWRFLRGLSLKLALPLLLLLAGELNPLLAPPNDRNRLALLLTAELGNTLKLDPTKKTVLFSYIQNRLSRGATYQDAMKALAETTSTEAADIKAMLSPEQQVLFDRVYGPDGVLLFSYAKAVALGKIGA